MPSASNLPVVPVFMYTPTTIHSGLDLLATAATTGSYPSLVTPVAGSEQLQPIVTAIARAFQPCSLTISKGSEAHPGAGVRRNVRGDGI